MNLSLLWSDQFSIYHINNQDFDQVQLLFASFTTV